MNALDLMMRLVRMFEGCFLRAYLCPAGIPTIGWGSTGPDVFLGLVWIMSQADARMRYDAMRFLTASRALCPTANTPGRQAALADFAYNLGLTRLKGSTLRKRVLANDWAGAAIELAKWTRGGGRVLPGLVRRRKAEIALLAA
jgi:lysozyme